MNRKHGNGSKRSQRLLVALLTFGYLSLVLMPAYASDTEVYAQSVSASAGTAPTVMLTLDASSNMAKCVTSTATCSAPNRRIDALRSAMQKVLFGSPAVAAVGTTPAIPEIIRAPGYVRVGMALVSGSTADGAKVRHAVRPLDAYIGLTAPDGTVSSQISTGNQDAEQQLATGTLDRTSVQNDLANEDGGLAQYIGFQFANVSVPKNATITSAYIEFTADSNTAGAVEWKMEVEDTDNAADFTTTGMIAGRTYSAVSASHIPENPWASGAKYRVPVDSLVQQVVNRAGWCGGNALSFRFSDLAGVTSRRHAYSYESALSSGDVTRAPKLVLTYSMTSAAAAATCIVAPFTTRVIVSDELDDAEWKEGSVTGLDHDNSGLSVAQVTATKRNHVGVRFRGVQVQKNATLSSATLSFVGQTAANSVPVLQVASFAHDNLPAFCTSSVSCTVPAETAADLSANLLWTLSPSKVVVGTTYSLDVKTLLQPLFNRAGWAAGNALGFRLRSNVTTSSNAAAFNSLHSGLVSTAPTLVLAGTQRLTNMAGLKTVRDELMDTVNAMLPSDNAPVGAGFVESARYLLGAATFSSLSDPSTYTGSPTTYISPVSAATECSGNYLLLMTSGAPDSAAQVNVNTAGFVPAACTSSEPIVGSGNIPLMWKCMYNTATYMAGGLNSIHTKVKTNTLALGHFAPDTEGTVANMAHVAVDGNGTAFTAESEADLVAALEATFAGALDEGASVSAPGVAVNQLSRLNHLDQLYFSVFDPDSNKAFWKGNVKRYRLGFVSNGTVSTPTIYDAGANGNGLPVVNGVAAGNPAVDPVTSFFKEGAQSWWSPAPDGRVAKAGGAASVLPAPDDRDGTGTERKMYTYLPAYPATNVTSNTPVSLQAVDLSSSSFNSAAKVEMGVADDNVYLNLMHWLQGYDMTDFDNGLKTVDTTSLLRHNMGGALHSRPILVNYGYSGTDATAAATDASLQDNTVYFSTMEGVFHAVNAATGKEQFAFMPKEKLSAVNTVARNGVASLPEFGLDLTWTVLREDTDSDFKITPGGSGDKVWAFGGMRMGGSNYYALDLTDRDTPKLKWAITAGAGAFQNMGQTWSQPVLGKIKIAGVAKTVIFFGGGYDPQHETAGSVRASDAKGNQVYIVDADTGALLWWASSTGSPTLTSANLKFSVPSELKLVDGNGDGLTDAVYFGDMGGQVFRLDLDNANTSAAGLGRRLQLLATLGQTVTADVVNQRRFYEAPSVARFSDPVTHQIYNLVALGSGYRSHPLNEATNDLFYVLRDNDAGRSDLLSATPSPALHAPLVLANLVAVDPSAATVSGVDMTGRMGWYVDFSISGEKVMASPFIFRNEVFFTSYVPTVNNAAACTPVYGRTRLYQMSVLNGALVDSNNDGVVSASDSVVTDNVVMGLGGEAQLVIPASGTPGLSPACGTVVLVGTNAICGDNIVQGAFRRLRWYNKSTH